MHAQADLPCALKQVSGEELESGCELEKGLVEVSEWPLIPSLRLGVGELGNKQL